MYSAHVSNIGWMPEVSDGAVAGTTGRVAAACEALKAEVATRRSTPAASSTAHTCRTSDGWPGPIRRTTSARSAAACEMEALEIRLTGDLADHYSIRYSAHVQDIGWQDWVADGQTAGTTGQARRVEAVKIELVPKGQ